MFPDFPDDKHPPGTLAKTVNPSPIPDPMTEPHSRKGMGSYVINKYPRGFLTSGTLKTTCYAYTLSSEIPEWGFSALELLLF